MKAKFEAFLSQLETDSNKSLIETVKKGYKAVTENYSPVGFSSGGYSDAVIDAPDALNTFNQRAAMTASYMGNNLLNFLQTSSNKVSHLYSVDEEPELDMMPTSNFNQHVEAPRVRDEIQEDLGLTAGDLAKLSH